MSTCGVQEILVNDARPSRFAGHLPRVGSRAPAHGSGDSRDSHPRRQHDRCLQEDGRTQVIQTVRVSNPNGLHLRVCAAIASTVGKHQAKVTVQKDGELHDAASILELLTLTATEGTALTFSAIGPDAAEVMRKLIALVGCTDDLPVAVAG